MSNTADTNPEAEAAPKSGLNMMGLIVLGLACATTSFASVFFLAPSPAPVTTVAAATEPVEAPKEKPATAKNHTYTPVQEILITIGHAPATRYLKMQVSVATDKTMAKDVKSAETALLDAFLLYLRSVEVSDFEDPNFYNHMREQLARRADLVLGDGVSKGVMITEFLLR